MGKPLCCVLGFRPLGVDAWQTLELSAPEQPDQGLAARNGGSGENGSEDSCC